MTDLATESLNQPIADYADVADLYELCACRKEQTRRICRSHEALRRERDTATTDAARYRWLRQQFALGNETYLAEHITTEVELDLYIDNHNPET